MTVVIVVTAVSNLIRKGLTPAVVKSISPKGVNTRINVITPKIAATPNESFTTVEEDTALHFSQEPEVRLLSLDLETTFTKAGTMASTKGSMVVIQKSVKPMVVAICTLSGQRAPKKVDM